MSILSKQNNSAKWKNKYFDLLDANDEREQSFKSNEQLLCKTIIRLSLATTGFNKALDPYLLGIRKQLKNGLKSEQLKAELERFSNALMTLDDIVPEDVLPDATVLFEFLFQHFPQKKIELQHIEVKFEKNEFPNPQYLFVAINDLIDSIQHVELLANNVVELAECDSIDYLAINAQLLQLIEGAEVPAKFEDQAQELKDQLHCNAPFSGVFQQTVALLFQIKKHIQSEQQEMAEFLVQLTDQLTELGIKASGVQAAVKSSVKKRNLLDQSVSSQMLDLQKSSHSATQIEPLKELIHSRLEDISQQIQKQRQQEQSDRTKMNLAFEVLTAKMAEMEQESGKLQQKLNLAHQRAIHDPLTGLPNRLAYDTRLNTELARFKRYQTPLSLLIWDIDFFKAINDTFGHKAGDKTLVLIAKLLSHHCRETDFVSRFGGEEFSMLLSDTDKYSALQTADKLRQIIEETAFNSNGEKIAITISCGITQFTLNDTPETAFNRADKALYKAKNNGRNQCVTA